MPSAATIGHARSPSPKASVASTGACTRYRLNDTRPSQRGTEAESSFAAVGEPRATITMPAAPSPASAHSTSDPIEPSIGLASQLAMSRADDAADSPAQVQLGRLRAQASSASSRTASSVPRKKAGR